MVQTQPAKGKEQQGLQRGTAVHRKFENIGHQKAAKMLSAKDFVLGVSFNVHWYFDL